MVKKKWSNFPANALVCAPPFFLLNTFPMAGWQISDTSWKKVTDFVLEVVLHSILSADN